MERASSLSFMPSSQQSSRTAGRVGKGEAVTLRAASAGLLRVSAGRVWVTPTSTAAHASRDVFLQAGEQLPLAAGQEIVVEGWPSARFELVAVPHAAGAIASLQRLVRTLSASRSSAAPAPQCCS
ncbi:DUF2917 domain-containing protein [Schlegelella sp. S2-27]|uniref:DUF2917 domain-containing protein n=1 Tax=Caldimonas mangrovi TaxID=2944811 RepID=A0ABT0YKR5_9BURK|nr:DUF2917 domain-containing protein [Caldimonas mangrovi]MCM5679326.1 DUF2917 domain-containing protein [Caldimonas mangrovi]